MERNPVERERETRNREFFNVCGGGVFFGEVSGGVGLGAGESRTSACSSAASL